VVSRRMSRGAEKEASASTASRPSLRPGWKTLIGGVLTRPPSRVSATVVSWTSQSHNTVISPCSVWAHRG
jgi:hypothetical protein